MKPAVPLPAAARPAPGALAAAALVAVAVALRAWRLRQGLPDFLDEAIPFKQALAMWGWDAGRPDLNPHFFNYPTFAIYLHLLVQKLVCALGQVTGRFAGPDDFRLLIETDPTGPVIAARLLGIAADAAAVWGAWRLGERLRGGAGLVAAALVAFSPTLIGTARAIQVDSVMAALSVWALERLLAWRAEGGRGRLAAAVVLIGLAAGAKYPAGLLVLPLGWVLWDRDGARGLRRWPLLAAGALGVFVLSSPYVALDFPAFWTGFSRERLHMAEGHLGVAGRTGAFYYLKGLVTDLGPVAAVALLLSLAGLRRGEPARGAVATLWIALLPQLAALALFRMEAERYLAPVIPVAACLAAAAALVAGSRLGARLPAPRRGAATVALAAALLLPPAVGGARAGYAGRDTTQQQARRWCEAHLGATDILVEEPYGPLLPGAGSRESVRRTASFARASAPARHRFQALRSWRAVVLPMTVSGRLEVHYARDDGSPLLLTVFPQAPDFNQAFYDPALFDGVDWFVTSAAVRRRYAADPARYPVQNALYTRLDAVATEAARFTPGGSVIGPEIIVYRLGERYTQDLRRSGESLDLFWWARPVPRDFRLAADAALIAPGERSGGDYRRPSGVTAGWILALRPPFDVYVQPFSLELAQLLAQAGRAAPARRHVAAILAVEPDAAPAALLFSWCALRMDDAPQARRMLENTLRLQERDGRIAVDVRVELGRVLLRLGEGDAAREQLARAAREAPPGSAAAQKVAQLLASIASGAGNAPGR